MRNFDRQYRFSAGPAGGTGFEVGATSRSQPTALHISFSIQKADTESQNTSKITLWNLSPSQLATLNEKDCIVVLKAGYGNHMPLVFTGAVSFVQTTVDGADRMTEIEAIDGRIEIRDTYISVSYSGVINTKKIIDDIAQEMGVTVTYSYNAEFVDLPNGFSFVGQAKNALDKACASSGLSWSFQNGILQVKKLKDTMSQEVFLLTPETGLINIPKKVSVAAEDKDAKDQTGWDVDYLMNAAINIDDYVRVESKAVTGYFRVYSIEIEGDNIEGSWMCTARLLEV